MIGLFYILILLMIALDIIKNFLFEKDIFSIQAIVLN